MVKEQPDDNKILTIAARILGAGRMPESEDSSTDEEKLRMIVDQHGETLQLFQDNSDGEDNADTGNTDEFLVPSFVRSKTIDTIMSDVKEELTSFCKTEIGSLNDEIAKQKKRADDLKKQLDEKFEFEEVQRGDLMTFSSCKWFLLLGLAHFFFYVLYYKIRGSGDNDDEDEEDGIWSEIDRLSIYSGAYFFIAIWDIFWSTILPGKVTCERNTNHTHVIVAAHRARDSLAIMLPSVLKTFPADCIHVADNGFRDETTQELCDELGVHYHYNAVGNKANALLVVARKIRREFGDAVRNVVLLDDDTLLEDSFFIRHDLLSDPKVGGYCVAIGVDRSSTCNVWEIAIDFEYRAISYAFGSRATCSTIPFCHGICAVYKLDLLIEQYEKNWSLPGGLPFGEDGYAGLDFRLEGFKLLQDNDNLVLTYCPRRFFPPLCSSGRVQGYGASSLWKQRGCRWFLSWPRQFPRELWLALTYNAGTWYGNIVYRVGFIWWLFLNVVSVAWIPYLFYVWLKHESWILVFVLKGMLTVTGVLVAIIRILFFPKKLRKGIHPLAPLCAPFLGMANSVLRFAGFFMSMYWFIPFVRIGKLKVLGDEDNDSETVVSSLESDVERGSSSGSDHHNNAGGENNDGSSGLGIEPMTSVASCGVSNDEAASVEGSDEDPSGGAEVSDQASESKDESENHMKQLSGSDGEEGFETIIMEDDDNM